MKLKKLILIVLLFIFLFVPLIRLPTAPRWNIKLSDKIGAPIGNCRVYEDWQFYGISGASSDSKFTDINGFVSFPARHAWASPGGYLGGKIFGFIAVHASFGPSVHIETSPKGYVRKLIYFYHGTPDTNTIVVKEELQTKLVLENDPLYDAVQSGDLEKMKAALASDHFRATGIELTELANQIVDARNIDEDRAIEMLKIALAISHSEEPMIGNSYLNRAEDDGLNALQRARKMGKNKIAEFLSVLGEK
jgi:hypothetical protein